VKKENGTEKKLKKKREEPEKEENEGEPRREEMKI
jgi:hypothetical protein